MYNVCGKHENFTKEIWGNQIRYEVRNTVGVPTKSSFSIVTLFMKNNSTTSKTIARQVMDTFFHLQDYQVKVEAS